MQRRDQVLQLVLFLLFGADHPAAPTCVVDLAPAFVSGRGGLKRGDLAVAVFTQLVEKAQVVLGLAVISRPDGIDGTMVHSCNTASHRHNLTES